MAFWNKKKDSELSKLRSYYFTLGQKSALDYNKVRDWLVGLSDEDYQTMQKVARIYRKSDKDAAKALGIDLEPTTFISDPEPDITDQLIDDVEKTAKVHIDKTSKPKSSEAKSAKRN